MSTTLPPAQQLSHPADTVASGHLVAAAEFAGRLALAAIFVLAGLNKIGAFEGTQAYMSSVGVPGALLPLVIALEVGGAALLVAGFATRLIALALAAFCVISGLLFHADLADQTQFILFWKNIAMAGGFLVVAAHGAGPWSVDARRA
jgi:putative oxidoreductase